MSREMKFLIFLTVLNAAIAFSYARKTSPTLPTAPMLTQVRTNAKVASIYDGDTIRANIMLGYNVWLMDQPIRLASIDAPEVRGEEREEGIAARDALREKLPVGTTVHIDPKGKGKYGRWIATVCYQGEDISAWLVENGFAKFKTYKGE